MLRGQDSNLHSRGKQPRAHRWAPPEAGTRNRTAPGGLQSRCSTLELCQHCRREDSNLQPPAPQAGDSTKLVYDGVIEAGGLEPPADPGSEPGALPVELRLSASCLALTGQDSNLQPRASKTRALPVAPPVISGSRRSRTSARFRVASGFQPGPLPLGHRSSDGGGIEPARPRGRRPVSSRLPCLSVISPTSRAPAVRPLVMVSSRRVASAEPWARSRRRAR